jgi:hypothetical protein
LWTKGHGLVCLFEAPYQSIMVAAADVNIKPDNLFLSETPFDVAMKRVDLMDTQNCA